ncbi:MAG: DUF5009 domain-containing protein [bacterium]
MKNELTNRALGLDALRGLAILMMFLSGLVPFYTNTLPDWMYHGQIPPPLHQFNPNLPGITWVDLVFPFFIFSMGAAIPLALNSRLEKGVKLKTILLQIFERGLLLAGFAIFIQHVKPYALNSTPNIFTWLTALLGFVLLFPVLYKYPLSFNKKHKTIIKLIGFLIIILLLFILRYNNGSGFLLTRSDIIILVLANVSFFGSIIWLITQKNILIRLSLLLFLLAFRLGHTEIGWIKAVWDFTPFPWLYTFYYLQYLFVLIPGTIIGDMIYLYMKEKPNNIQKGLNTNILAIISVLMLVINVIVLIGLKTRYVEYTLGAAIIFGTINYYLLSKAANVYEILFKKMFYWGMYFLLLGLAFEPFEGGIKKDHPTLSYYFVTVGLAVFTLIGLMIIIDILKKQKVFSIIIANGQNPLTAYAGITNLIPPILALTGLGEVLSLIVINPWLGLLKALFITFLLGFIVSFFTKFKIYLRT